MRKEVVIGAAVGVGAVVVAGAAFKRHANAQGVDQPFHALQDHTGLEHHPDFLALRSPELRAE